MGTVTKVTTLIGGITGLVSTVNITFGVRETCSGVSNGDPHMPDKGIEKVAASGAAILVTGGIVAYVIIQVGAIHF